ncbi:hypothetical protein KKJ06_09510 [Xenorhabdus bovienii]|uniref:hypothetical protein n=1 Tax=Xenorhabdus bovienii TaxID=40576 RepID=UPI0023B2754C|nr:hypothetical protein [Xenorhabdus bovienii]MDE9555660.1 hypothetical protein [Xenorhabdus bovienii]
MDNIIKISVEDKSNVAIGQIFSVVITLESDIAISDSVIVTLENLNKITASATNFSMNSGKKSSSVSVEFSIFKDIKDGDQISFDIVLNKNTDIFFKRTIHYTGKEIDPDSLKLYFDCDVIPALAKNFVANVPPTGTSYALVTAIVKDSMGTVLSGIPVTIIGKNKTDLDNVNIFLSNNNAKTEVKKQQFIGGKAIVLPTDENGKLEFYVYPSVKDQFILELESAVMGHVDFTGSINKLFVINGGVNFPVNEPNNDKLWPPDILEYTDGKLMGENNSSTFSVSIIPYEYANRDDTILFFIDGKYVNQKFLVGNLNNLGHYFIHLPYTILPVNESVNLSYVVVSKSVNTKYSFGKIVIYDGVGKNQPLNNVKRIYDRGKVYSSFGPSTSSNLVFPNDTVNYFTISRYMNNKGHDGLFVVITGTNDPTDKTKVPFGSTVTLTLRIDSYKVPVYKTFTQTMPTKSDQGSKNTATLTFNIPYKDVSHIISYPNGSAGRIYFDYQVNELGKITYGKIWEAKIDTVPPSPDGDPDEGGSN